jgi:hypothetical protein
VSGGHHIGRRLMTVLKFLIVGLVAI